MISASPGSCEKDGQDQDDADKRSACSQHAESHLDLELSLDAHEELYEQVAGAGLEVASGV